jgi:predicted dehydrogenase/threonine dehydrogenase-like Zn-dependent dehydrogenase
MLQILQSLRNGTTSLTEVPSATAGPGGLLIRTNKSLVSAGTERMLLDFGKAGWIAKARQRPDKIGMVLDKIKTDGILSTIDSVRAKLDQPIPLGYSNAGVVLETGPEITAFHGGDRVVSSGAHAEVVAVPKNLCARIPDSVSDESAAFTVVGAIALQGIRLVEPSLGEAVVVTGLGLIGLLTVQLLRAHGCRVLGIDFDRHKLELAEAFGAETVDLAAGEDPLLAAERFSRGRGVDAVLITAATKSSDPMHQAALMSRKRGRIVLVGVAGLELRRDDFYEKELKFQVSCSYGPGRYDPAYELGGHDYPYGHVRWTAQRNFEAVLDMIADGRLQLDRLITHRFPFDRALDAYALLEGDEPHIGILLDYDRDQNNCDVRRRITFRASAEEAPPAVAASIGFIGAGAYASKVLIPAFQSAGAHLVSIASAGGVSAAHAGRKFGFEEATTDVDAVLADPRIDTVVIATRHDSHATLVCRALKAGKHVFVEKPLALKPEEVDEIEATYNTIPRGRLLMAGFNRRFAPHVQRMRQLLTGLPGPKAFVYTINAGFVSSGHWTQDPESGGGRILGEVCHFVDLLRFLAGCPVKHVQTAQQSSDTVSISLTYEEGSIGTIHYFAGGHKSFPKERLEVFGGGRVLVLDNFRNLRGYGVPRFRKMTSWRQDKGVKEMASAFVTAIRERKSSPIPFEELLEVARLMTKAVSL